MINAVMQRMVEESLVEKEVYEAMLQIRAKIEESIGGNVSQGYETPQNAAPDFPELPVGNPDALRAMGVPVRDGAPSAPHTSRTPPPPQGGDRNAAGIPTDVLLSADPVRDPNQRVAPYVPPTVPASTTDPFPQLGPKGRPLG